MGTLVTFHNSGGSGSITETDIDNLLVIANRIARDQQIYDRIAEGVLDRLSVGGEVDAGPRTVGSEVTQSDGVVEERLLIDAVCRFRRLRGSTSRIDQRARPIASGAF